MVQAAAELPISVAVVDDEPEVRALFESAVRSHPRLTLAFGAGSAAEAKHLAPLREAQVWLVDLGLPDLDGRELIRWICGRQPDASVMVVTVFGDDRHVVSSFEAGAVGYLLKDTPPDQIALAILDLHAGGSPISPSVARHVLRRFVGRGSGPVPADDPLSDREREVLQLIEKGMTYDEVAQALDISWHTVTTFLRRVYRKLQVNSRTEAVYEARQRGIL